jgi:hypothetical protein
MGAHHIGRNRTIAVDLDLGNDVGLLCLRQSGQDYHQSADEPLNSRKAQSLAK